ncbi:hypothetical protein F2S32_14710 [Alistipes onderdonkii]|nr:hypothetical protein F2S32_14710 [Alistipes onderdonkii]
MRSSSSADAGPCVSGAVRSSCMSMCARSSSNCPGLQSSAKVWYIRFCRVICWAKKRNAIVSRAPTSGESVSMASA